MTDVPDRGRRDAASGASGGTAAGATVVAAATADELAAVEGDWSRSEETVAGSPLRVTDDDDVHGLVTGVGPADAGMRVAAALERFAVDAVVSVGVAGALPGGGLGVGDAVVGTDAVFGDLGRRGPEGYTALDGMGLDGATAGPFPLAGIDASGDRGRIATVSTVSASDARAEHVAERTDAVAETMETAAVARVGAAYGVPVAAVAGIANRAATDRYFDANAGLDALAASLDGVALEVTP